MQTFITSLNLEQSAYSLWENGVSGNRLSNQINEALIILRTLTGWYAERGRKGWPNHPATKMWSNYQDTLFNYTNTCVVIYERLSGNDCEKRYSDLQELYPLVNKSGNYPHWLTEEFCSNHRAILLGKAWEAYSYLTDKMISLQNERVYHQIGSIEEIALTKDINRYFHKIEKSWQILNWYQSLNWTEQPAVKVDGKWPYLWPVK